MHNLYIFYFAILIKFTTGSITQNDTTSASCSKLNNQNDQTYSLADYLEDIQPKNWTKILEIMHVLGLPLQNWRHSEEICVRGDNIVISRQSIYCFKTTAISDITRQLYAIYDEAYQSYNVPNLKDMEILTNEIDKFEMLDFYLLLKCILLTPDQISSEKLNYFVGIVENLLDSQFLNHKMFMVFNKLTSILYSAKRDFAITNPNLFLTLWHPFRSNVTGFALYDNPNNKFTIRSIYRNESAKDIEQNGLRMAGFVPYDLLSNITKGIPPKRKSRLYIQMVMVLGSESYANFFKPKHNSKYLIGLSIPRFCKTNKLPLIEVFFNSTNPYWASLGENFKDSDVYDSSEMCLLDKMSYFGPRSANNSGQQDTLLQQKCMPTIINTNTTTIIFHQQKHDFIMHPTKLCLNKLLQIPILVCHEGLVFDIGDFELDCFNHPTSNRTEGLYSELLKCYSGGECQHIPKFLDKTDLTYLDVKLYFLILKRIRIMHYYSKISPDASGDVLERGITLLQREPQSNRQLHYLADFMDSFVTSLTEDYANHPVAKRNFIYRSVDPTSKTNPSYGLILRDDDKYNFQIENLTTTNLTSDFTCDESIKVVVVLLEDHLVFSTLDEAIIFNIFIVETTGGNRIVGVRHMSYIHYEKVFKFAVFLRNQEDGKGEWTVINSESEVMSIAYASVERSEVRILEKRVKSFKHVQ